MKPKIYIGFDPREDMAYQVARHSILSRTDEAEVEPLKLEDVPFIQREETVKDGQRWCIVSDAPVTTDFAISRFAIPFLQSKGWALFVDPDIVCKADIKELFALADNRFAVMVVKHNQVVRESKKDDGQLQSSYPRKNWSSVVLWNCEHEGNKRLTKDMLNNWPGRDLHAFKWLADDEIGELPNEWNYLVGVNEPMKAKIFHFTLGGPWFKNWAECLDDAVWKKEFQDLNT